MRHTCISRDDVTDDCEASRMGRGAGVDRALDWEAPRHGSCPGPDSGHLARTPRESSQPSPEILWAGEGAPSLRSCAVQGRQYWQPALQK